MKAYCMLHKKKLKDYEVYVIKRCTKKNGDGKWCKHYVSLREKKEL